MNLNDKLKLEKTGMTQNELDRLRCHLADRIVSQMSMEDLVQFVFDDYVGYFEKLPDVEFIDEARQYWEDGFDDVVEEVKEYANSDFKKPKEDREASNIFIDINNTGGKY